MISEELVKEFQEIVKRKYGRNISYDEAFEIANGIVSYFSLLKKTYLKMKKRD